MHGNGLSVGGLLNHSPDISAKNARSMPTDSSEPPMTPRNSSPLWEVPRHTSTTTSANPNLAHAPTPEFCYKVVLKNPKTHIFDSSNLFFGSGGSLDPPDLNKCLHLTLTCDKKQFLEDVDWYLWGDKDFEDGIVIPMSLHEGLSVCGQTADGCVLYHFPAVQQLLTHTALSFPNSVYQLIFYDPDSDSSEYTTSDKSLSDDDMNIYVDNSDSKDFKNTAPPHATSALPLDSSPVFHYNISQAYLSPPASVLSTVTLSNPITTANFSILSGPGQHTTSELVQQTA
ncbi:unnamed protein product [Cyclocybe aegerita]|uniref:Uncharacterized protein n=1 Tax=Cyclocybe aegerita TaxID=1973307 RepID=A0A8S0WCL8_CYCAE|nr:unnamed protein product [Cyclocybe aegerita]